MITDTIRNAADYKGISAGIRKALEYLETTDFSTMAPGRYAIDGDRIYAMVQEYETKPREDSRWEAHRRYTDVQYVVSGIERMGYAPLDSLTVTAPYAEDKDVLRLDGEGSFLTVPARTFAVFFPQDAHLPGLANDAPVRVRKVVVKVETQLT